MAIDFRLLEILVCPVSHAPLKEVGDSLVSTDADTRMRYRVDDGIPVMLIAEAEELTIEAWNEAMGNG